MIPQAENMTFRQRVEAVNRGHAEIDKMTDAQLCDAANSMLGWSRTVDGKAWDKLEADGTWTRADTPPITSLDPDFKPQLVLAIKGRLIEQMGIRFDGPVMPPDPMTPAPGSC